MQMIADLQYQTKIVQCWSRSEAYCRYPLEAVFDPPLLHYVAFVSFEPLLYVLFLGRAVATEALCQVCELLELRAKEKSNNNKSIWIKYNWGYNRARVSLIEPPPTLLMASSNAKCFWCSFSLVSIICRSRCFSSSVCGTLASETVYDKFVICWFSIVWKLLLYLLRT